MTVTLYQSTDSGAPSLKTAWLAAALSNPSNAVAGQSGVIAITQNASTAYTLAFGSQWIEAATGTAPTLSTTLSAVNLLSYQVIDATHIWYTLLKHGVA